MAGIRTTRQCYGCKQYFRREELVEYASIRAMKGNWYCPACLREKQDRDLFSEKVCEIFGLKTPGPRIWTERKRLQNEYGYTDGVIIDCLEYIYNVRHFKKLSESLALVTPKMVMDMKKWKRSEEGKAGGIIAAMATPIEHVQVEIQENTHSNKKEININDYLDD
jgi:hypothetical protein